MSNNKIVKIVPGLFIGSIVTAFIPRLFQAVIISQQSARSNRIPPVDSDLIFIIVILVIVVVVSYPLYEIFVD